MSLSLGQSSSKKACAIALSIALGACSGGGVKPAKAPAEQRPENAIGTTHSRADKKADRVDNKQKTADEYAKLVKQIKSDQSEVDFDRLRLAYTETEHYSPYLGPETSDAQLMFEAYKRRDFPACAEHADKILGYNFTSLNAHYGALACHAEQGRQEKADFHKYMLNRLLDSIGNSGDGKTPETAFIVISSKELYAFLQLAGLQAKGQSLVQADGRAYDLMNVINPETGEEFDMYFDITIQMSKGIMKKM